MRFFFTLIDNYKKPTVVFTKKQKGPYVPTSFTPKLACAPTSFIHFLPLIFPLSSFLFPSTEFSFGGLCATSCPIVLTPPVLLFACEGYKIKNRSTC